MDEQAAPQVPAPQEPTYDVIVAGGGISGVLAAARLATAHPEKKILLLEREAQLGGRLRGTSSTGRGHGYGLNAVSDQLFAFWNQTARFDPSGEAAEGEDDLARFIDRRQTKMGILAGNEIRSVDIEAWFTPKGARVLGGLTAAREWPEVEAVLKQVPKAGASRATEADADDHEADEGQDAKEKGGEHAFSHYWKKPRKAPAAVVAEHFGSAFGIPDIWNATPSAVAARAAFHSSRLHCGDWDAAMASFVARSWFKERVTVRAGSLIADAAFADGVWTIAAEGGPYTSRALIVAQPPWQAIIWLPRSLWPAHLLSVPSKTKPVSIVVLSEHILQPAIEMPDVVIVPSERVQVVRNNPHDIVFQATIDYELSLQAPAVVKAVRSLKRARKKLELLYPGAISETNHIALQPVAWAQSPTQTDRRWVTRATKKSFNSKTLAFCGDAYGDSYDGDQNIIKSMVAACEAVGPGL